MPIPTFIEHANETETISDLVILFRGTIAHYGYSKFCSFNNRGLQPDLLPDALGRTHYNTQFLEAYERGRFTAIDPVYQLFSHTHQPFTWKKVRSLPLSKKQMDVMDLRTSTGSASGISMPIHSADINIVGMSLSSEHTDARHDRNAVSELYAIANHFHLCRAALSLNNELALPNVKLSPREAEMLMWCSHGKSNSVIAIILGVSEKTVEFHLRSAFKKLSVSNRTAAVLKATKLRLIASHPSPAVA